jgi:putative DNA primase/helicase
MGRDEVRTDFEAVRFGASGTKASAIKQAPLKWLWPDWIVAGELTLLIGDPSVGKSLVWIDLVARITSGRPLPGTKKKVSGTVLAYTAEESRARIIVPRLVAAGANLERVIFPEPPAAHNRRPPERLKPLPEGIEHVAGLIGEYQPRLVVFDALADFLSPSVEANSEIDVRNALTPLIEVAQRSETAALGVRHLNKRSGDKALYRMLGSTGFMALARAALLVERHGDGADGRALACVKNNLVRDPRTLTFGINESDSGVAYVEWTGTSELNADDLADQAADAGRAKLEAGKEFLRESLEGGPQSVQTINRNAIALGHSQRTLARARRELGIKAGAARDPESGKLKEWRIWLPENQ